MAVLMAVAAASAQAQMPASGEASAQADGAARQKTASHDGKAGQCHARMAERHAKRMAALKERLKISPAQEDAWNQFRMANHVMNATAAKAERAVQKPDSGAATARALCRLMAPMAARRAADAGGPCRPLAFML